MGTCDLISSVNTDIRTFSFSSLQVSGVAVEVVEATVFFRQNWMVVMVDLVVACSLGKNQICIRLCMGF